MRILITGAGGQLGQALEAALKGDDVLGFSHSELDITSRNAVRRAIGAAESDTVVHCAAWTDTAGCERDPARALLVNSKAAGFVAEACREAGAAMVYVSSNEVFDGEKGAPYDEEDAVNPVNEYGRSKLAGEEAVAAALPHHQIVRTSWLYGPGRASFPEKILVRARADGRLRLVTDEIASPTWTRDLAGAICALVRQPEYGVFHLTNAGQCSRAEWGHEIIRLASLDIPVEETTQAAFDLPYRKPVLSTLANGRAAALGITMRDWQEALSEHMRTTGALSEVAGR
jgi:dTDP-4-dehydrorhamnose reductase